MTQRSGMAKRFGRFAVAGVLCGWWGLGNLAWGQSLESMTWKSVSECTSVPEVEFYLKSFPDGQYVRDARECLVRLARSEPRFRFRDKCAECPELVLIPPGTYTMGSERRETGRSKYEEPRHEVTIGVPFAVGMHEVTRGEFDRFVKETGHWVDDSCFSMSQANGKWNLREGISWAEPGYDQEDRHPVVCAGWEDAKAYVDWLSDKSDAEYRLLSESEWEYVARAGTDTPRYWGRSTSVQCQHENGLDRKFTSRFGKFRWRTAPCSDSHVHTAPVASAGKPNGFGLYDMLGNARGMGSGLLAPALHRRANRRKRVDKRRGLRCPHGTGRLVGQRAETPTFRNARCVGSGKPERRPRLPRCEDGAVGGEMSPPTPAIPAMRKRRVPEGMTAWRAKRLDSRHISPWPDAPGEGPDTVGARCDVADRMNSSPIRA